MSNGRSKKRRSQSARIITVSIRPKSNISYSIQDEKSIRSMANRRTFKSSTVCSSQVKRIEKTQGVQANTTDYTNKKKKYPNRRCLTKILIVLFILIIIIAIILAVLLMRSKAKKSSNLDRVAILRWNSIGITVAGVTGQLGNTSDKLSTPRGIYLDWSNALYIADEGNSRIQKYSKDASVGETVAGQASGINGVGASFLSRPYDVAVDSNENIFVADSYNQRIQLWTRGSSIGTTIAGTTGVVGNASNNFNYPYGIEHNSITGGIYVADVNNYRIMYYPTGVLNGTIVAGGNGPGINNNQLSTAHSLYHDVVTNSLFIPQCAANNIIQWTLGASSWTLVAGYLNGTRSNTSSGFGCTRHIVLDPMGNMYVVDRDNRRIQLFIIGQTNGITIAGITGILGANASLLNNPVSVALDTQLNVYVSDVVNHRIQKFLRY